MIRLRFRWARWCIAVLSLTVIAGGCDKSGGSSTGAGSAAASGPTAPPAVAAWSKAGLAVSAFTKDHSGALGDDCQSGTVSGLDVVVCKFETEQAAKAAETKGLAWVGEATGACVASRSHALAVVDRRKADPSGRTINQVIKLFRDTMSGK